MARVTYSPVVADVRGKAADAVFSSWKGRGYIRQRVVPANPNTAAQQVVRESMARIPPLWRSLETQIKTVQDAYAAAYGMSGYNWYTKNNRVNEESNEAGLFTPPNTAIEFPASITLGDEGGGSCKVDWTGGTQGAGYYIYILSRKIEAGEVVNKFDVEDSDTTLVSAETKTITLAASKDFLVAIAVELIASNEFSMAVYDTITMGA